MCLLTGHVPLNDLLALADLLVELVVRRSLGCQPALQGLLGSTSQI